MTTNILNQTVPFSKEALYDKIGELNIEIIALEAEVPALDLQSHEKRQDLRRCKEVLKQVRMRLRSTLELELERTEKTLRERYSSAFDLEDLTNHRAQLALEIEKLTKLLDNA
jgi:hypothetical protein